MYVFYGSPKKSGGSAGETDEGKFYPGNYSRFIPWYNVREGREGWGERKPHSSLIPVLCLVFSGRRRRGTGTLIYIHSIVFSDSNIQEIICCL